MIFQKLIHQIHPPLPTGGVEWTFAGGAGVFYSDDPKTAPGATYRESIDLGEFSGTSRDVDKIIDSLRPRFQGDSYNLLTKNCNSFADALVQQLLGTPIPPYVNRLAYLGSFVPQVCTHRHTQTY